MTDFLSGGGEMSVTMGSLDWAATPIGPVDSWPPSLRNATRICLTSHVPTLIWWGPELGMLYNDAAHALLGATRHLHALGQPGREGWPALWDVIGPLVEGVLATGTATRVDDQLLLINRSGSLEECSFTCSFSPLQTEAGRVGGVFCAVTETTQRLLGEFRLRTLHNLARSSASAQSLEAACEGALAALADTSSEIPFAALYLTEPDGRRARLAGTTSPAPALPPDVTLDPVATVVGLEALIANALRHRQPVLIENTPSHWPQLTQAPWSEPPRSWLVLPIIISEPESPVALLLVAISPRRSFDEGYRGFLELVASQIASRLAVTRAYAAERQHAEALVVREQLEQILQGIKDDFVMYDDDWRYVYVNEQAARSLGYPKEQLIGQIIWDLFPQAVGNRFYEEMLRAKLDECEVVFEHYYAPWGKWIENRAYPVPNGMLLFAADITARKQVEEALRVSDERARLAISAARLGTWHYDPNSGIVTLDERMRAIWGESAVVPAIPLLSMLEGVHPEDRTRVADDIERAFDPRSAGVYESEYRIVWPDGTEHWVAANGQVQFAGAGAGQQPASFIGTALDITERKQVDLERTQLYEAERAARAAAEQAARQRDELLAYIVHDLKNPLTALLGATQLLQRRLRTPADVDVERLRHGLGTIETAAIRLAAQLNELQDGASLHVRHPLNLQSHRTDLVALVERVVTLRQASTEQHQIWVDTPLTELPCMCDPFRIERVITNLLGNAIKYSPQGGDILVRISRTTDGAGEGALIEVGDQGMGIPAADLPHIFERFYRGRNVDGQSGTGLGLASAQAIILQHGGVVSVASELGKGTVVTVHLPLNPAGLPPPATGVGADTRREE